MSFANINSNEAKNVMFRRKVPGVETKKSEEVYVYETQAS